MLAERGRLSLEPDAQTWVRRAFQAVPFREAPVNHEIAIQSRAIDLEHRDPADRFLAATALNRDHNPARCRECSSIDAPDAARMAFSKIG